MYSNKDQIREENKMNKAIKYVLVGLLLVSLVSMAALSCKAEKPSAEPIRVGAIAPLAGECSLWGIPMVRCCQIYAELLNAEGGILAGGEYHPVEVTAYDNVCYIPDEELKVAKKAALDDGVKFIIGTNTLGCRRATIAFTTEQKVLVSSYGPGYLSPDYPYTMSPEVGCPANLAIAAEYIVKKHPEIKKVAITCADAHPEIAPYYEAACKALGLEIVYEKPFPVETFDFTAYMTAVIATGPDLILEYATPAQGVFLAAAKRAGFTGYVLMDDMDEPSILDAVSAEDVEGKAYSAGAMNYADPLCPPKGKPIYDRYIEQYGEAEWASFAGGYSTVMMVVLEVGIPAADSIDPTDVMNALYAMPEVDHPMFGKGTWSGMEIWGCNHHLLTPSPVFVFRGGKVVIADFVSATDWWERNKDAVLSALAEHKMLYQP